MAKTFFSVEAKLDLKEIAEYIAQDSKSNAIAYIRVLQGKCRKLADAPKIGVEHGSLRKFPVGNYLIFYREQKKGIEIIRILNANRDISAIMK